jgi:large subunit ribosomal protein L1
MKIDEALKYIRENTTKRKFMQTFDLAVNLSNIDLKKPENKISKEIMLPHSRTKDVKVCLISDSITSVAGIDVVGKNFIMGLEGDKKAGKQFSRKYDFFICEAPLMALVGRILGRYLGPRGKMPKLLPPGRNPLSMADEAKTSVRLRIKDSPVIHCAVGDENMSDEQVRENVALVIEEIKKALPGKSQIKNAYLKLTMGSAVKLDVR